MRTTLLAILLLPAAVWAQAWRADLESGNGDGLGIALFICAGLAYVLVRDAYKVSRAKGHQMLAGAVAVAVGAVFFEPVRWVLVLIALFAFLYIAWDQLRG